MVPDPPGGNHRYVRKLLPDLGFPVKDTPKVPATSLGANDYPAVARAVWTGRGQSASSRSMRSTVNIRLAFSPGRGRKRLGESGPWHYGEGHSPEGSIICTASTGFCETPRAAIAAWKAGSCFKPEKTGSDLKVSPSMPKSTALAT